MSSRNRVAIHVQTYFNTDPAELVAAQPLKGILDQQQIGILKPEAPVLIDSNRFDPFVPWGGVKQLAQDWCAKGADIEFSTNVDPPLLTNLP
jgi:hypothetical protein